MKEPKSLPADYDEKLMEAEFEEGYKIMCAINEPFHKKMDTIFKMKKITSYTFVEKTKLNRQYYSKFRAEGYIPRMDTFISMCMGLNLDLPTAESLLASMRLGFDKTDRRHCAYMFLLTHYQGLCIDDCNKILRKLGFDDEKHLLGTFNKEDREENKKK